MTTHIDDEQILQDTINALQAKFTDRERSEIEAVVREEFERLRERPVRDYLSVLTEKAAKDRLRSSQRV